MSSRIACSEENNNCLKTIYSFIIFIPTSTELVEQKANTQILFIRIFYLILLLWSLLALKFLSGFPRM